jgi:hypothetical protein
MPPPAKEHDDFDRITAKGLAPMRRRGAARWHNLRPPNKRHVEMCRRWLRESAVPCNVIRRNYTSAELCGLVEVWLMQLQLSTKRPLTTYLSNGAFIEAARLEGYRIVRVRPRSPDAYFNIRIKDLQPKPLDKDQSMPATNQSIKKYNSYVEITANGLWPAPFLVGGVEGPERQPPDAEEVQACRRWIRKHVDPSAAIREDHTSYGFKHLVEETIESYVSNGAFIEAARREGYEIVRDSEGSPNALFNMCIKPDKPKKAKKIKKIKKIKKADKK